MLVGDLLAEGGGDGGPQDRDPAFECGQEDFDAGVSAVGVVCAPDGGVGG
ncbi:hypothetical protein [Actinokineospora iranica]|nr:hypothetical protein [Actinokineospora iranica]